ncbi:MAG TPA: V-type ATP synthase subunit F [Spirochaetota bacterium]|nr:V-type ATP synthase subunit F [Spirochaetota bacterium]HPJ38569.1 V-type ATP synthase subunit F [Spirochaetota bacterium]HPQ54129.1 V-type ATP synthase subunit F [Spirochaetota bacterium]
MGKGDEKIAVVGTQEEVLPFFSVGALVRIAEDTASARDAVTELAASGIPVIIVSDAYLREMNDILDTYSVAATPCITSLPGKTGESRFTREYISMLVKRAVGIDLREIQNE